MGLWQQVIPLYYVRHWPTRYKADEVYTELLQCCLLHCMTIQIDIELCSEGDFHH